MFQKTVWLDINAYEYSCKNPVCKVGSTAETFDGFLRFRKCMTERCMKFICLLALETSCESSAKICKYLGIRTSGDSVIRMLFDYAEHHPAPICGDCIGVDDFAYKKGQNYCTVIVNEKDHNIIEGRDGSALKEWLKRNKQVRTVTCDRSSAYAKAIADELLDAMQIADRFHLHHNLMECVKDILNTKLPAYIKIPKGANKNSEFQLDVPMADDTVISGSKKSTDMIVHCESTYSAGELAQRKVYEKIPKLKEAGYTNRKIAKLLKVSRNTISKVIKSNIDELCRNNRKMLLDKYLTEITTGIKNGETATVIYTKLKADGKTPGSRSNFHGYLDKITRSLGLTLEKFRNQPVPLPDNTIPAKDFDYLKRTGVFQYLWEGGALTEAHRQFLFETYLGI